MKAIAPQQKQQNGRQPGPPQSRDKREKAVHAAYLRLLGGTQMDVAAVVGINRATLSLWETSDWWPEVKHDAVVQWIAEDLQPTAMAGLQSGVKRDGKLALDVLERVISELAPAAQRVQVKQEIDVTVSEVRERISNRIARIASSQ